MENPQVSLVICTKNRATQLRKCLQHVAEQRPPCPWELVVVDNGSSDETGAVLAAYAASVPFPARVVSEPLPGLGRARNAGWPVTCGDLIAFVDDDCYVAADYIDRLQAAFRDSSVGFAGGRVDLFDPADFPISIRTAAEPAFLEPRSYFQPGWIMGASMMFRREVLEAIGGFDPDLGPGTRFNCEDADALARASFAGWRGAYVPDAVIAHHHGRKAKDLPPLRRSYSTGAGAYTAKFLHASETRSIYLHNWYWTFRRTLAGGYAWRDLMWEMEGALGYLAYRLGQIIATKSPSVQRKS